MSQEGMIQYNVPDVWAKREFSKIPIVSGGFVMIA